MCVCENDLTVIWHSKLNHLRVDNNLLFIKTLWTFPGFLRVDVKQKCGFGWSIISLACYGYTTPLVVFPPETTTFLTSTHISLVYVCRLEGGGWQMGRGVSGPDLVMHQNISQITEQSLRPGFILLGKRNRKEKEDSFRDRYIKLYI